MHASNLCQVLHFKNSYLRLGSRMLAVYPRSLQSVVESTRPDAVIVEANPRILGLTRMIRSLRRRGIAVVGWGLGQLPRRGRLRRHAFGSLVRELDAALAYHSSAAASFHAAGAPRDSVFVAGNSTVSREEIDELAAVPRRGGAFRVGYVGRLIGAKNLASLVEGMAQLDLPDASLVLFGTGPMEAELKRHLAASGVSSHFAGHVPGTEVRRRIRDEMDVVVLPGLGGLALVDAMAAGVPVIATPGDGISADLVVDGTTGFCLPPNPTGEVVARRLREAHKAPLETLGNSAQERVRRGFVVERVAEVFVDAVEYALEQSR